MVWLFLASPVVQLLLLAAASAVVRWALPLPSDLPVAAPAAVMAVGIFALGPLPQLPFPGRQVGQLITLELLIVGAYMGGVFGASFLRGTHARYTKDPLACFAIGTWVAGLVVLERLVAAYLPPGWGYLLPVFGVLAATTWCGYMWITARSYPALLESATRRHVTGRILLTTVSVQAIVILGAGLPAGQVPQWLNTSLIILGLVLYMAGAALIAWRYLSNSGWTLAAHWDNTNCILHGALSISGLAAVVTRALPGLAIELIWIFAACMLIAVEAVEAVRAWFRVVEYGWRYGVFTYHVSQWSRNFTFGMFYTFTLALWSASSSGNARFTWLAPLQDAVISWGQYVVLLFLLVEVALFLLYVLGARRRPRRAVSAWLVGEKS